MSGSRLNKAEKTTERLHAILQMMILSSGAGEDS